MSRLTGFAFAVLIASACSGTDAAANLLANPGFEDPITFEGMTFVGSWEGFSGGGTASASNSDAMPRSGSMHALFSIQSDNSFAGVFQDVPNVVPGTPAFFSGWHRLGNVIEFDAGVEVRIEWRNSASNMEIGRTPNLTPVPTGAYTPFSLSATVPAGADTARVVYALQTFGPGPFNTGIVALDDLSYVVPEPTSLALLALGAFGLAAIHRGRA